MYSVGKIENLRTSAGNWRWH